MWLFKYHYHELQQKLHDKNDHKYEHLPCKIKWSQNPSIWEVAVVKLSYIQVAFFPLCTGTLFPGSVQSWRSCCSRQHRRDCGKQRCAEKWPIRYWVRSGHWWRLDVAWLWRMGSLLCKNSGRDECMTERERGRFTSSCMCVTYTR